MTNISVALKSVIQAKHKVSLVKRATWIKRVIWKLYIDGQLIAQDGDPRALLAGYMYRENIPRIDVQPHPSVVDDLVWDLLYWCTVLTFQYIPNTDTWTLFISARPIRKKCVQKSFEALMWHANAFLESKVEAIG